MQGYLHPADSKQCPCRPTRGAIYSGFPASICTLRKPYLQRILYVFRAGGGLEVCSFASSSSVELLSTLLPSLYSAS
jgi:hypothetical protein